MVLFLFALIVAVAGVGVYAHYNPGAQDITLPFVQDTTMHLHHYLFVGVPDWVPVAIGAAVPLFLFLLHALFAGARYRRLRRASEGYAGLPSRSSTAQAAPKRSWTTSGD